jgi:hypothetical protein
MDNRNHKSITIAPKVVALPSLKRRLHPEILPRMTGIAPSEKRSVVKTDMVGLDLTFSPIVAGPISLTNNGGSIATGAPVQLIFWGSVWNQEATSPSAGQIVTAVQNVLAGPYMSALRQYGIKRSPLGGATVVTTPGPPYPPDTFSGGDIQDLIWTLIDDDKFPEPDEGGGGNLYFVIMPPNTQYGPGGARGAHSVASDYDFPGGTTNAWVAWIGNNNIGQMTSTLCHELAEICTDPEGDGWTVDGQSRPTNEIGDICNLIDAPLDGVLVEAYWSQFDNVCLIPTSFSVRRTLKWAGITLGGKGLRSLQSPMPSLKNLLASL